MGRLRRSRSANGITFDPTRIAAQIVTGIGFLGAGAIIRQGLSVRGLTTAASLWVVAAIGMASGAGYYSAAVITTIVVLISLWPLRIVAYRMFERIRPGELRLEVELAGGREPVGSARRSRGQRRGGALASSSRMPATVGASCSTFGSTDGRLETVTAELMRLDPVLGVRWAN